MDLWENDEAKYVCEDLATKATTNKLSVIPLITSGKPAIELENSTTSTTMETAKTQLAASMTDAVKKSKKASISGTEAAFKAHNVVIQAEEKATTTEERYRNKVDSVLQKKVLKYNERTSINEINSFGLVASKVEIAYEEATKAAKAATAATQALKQVEKAVWLVKATADCQTTDDEIAVVVAVAENANITAIKGSNAVADYKQQGEKLNAAIKEALNFSSNLNEIREIEFKANDALQAFKEVEAAAKATEQATAVVKKAWQEEKFNAIGRKLERFYGDDPTFRYEAQRKLRERIKQGKKEADKEEETTVMRLLGFGYHIPDVVTGRALRAPDEHEFIRTILKSSSVEIPGLQYGPKGRIHSDLSVNDAVMALGSKVSRLAADVKEKAILVAKHTEAAKVAVSEAKQAEAVAEEASERAKNAATKATKAAEEATKASTEAAKAAQMAKAAKAAREEASATNHQLFD